MIKIVGEIKGTEERKSDSARKNVEFREQGGKRESRTGIGK